MVCGPRLLRKETVLGSWNVLFVRIRLLVQRKMTQAHYFAAAPTTRYGPARLASWKA